MRKVVAALLALVASSVFAQETIKIGVITDKVGPAKPYSEGFCSAPTRSTQRAGSSAARSSS